MRRLALCAFKSLILVVSCQATAEEFCFQNGSCLRSLKGLVHYVDTENQVWLISPFSDLFYGNTDSKEAKKLSVFGSAMDLWIIHQEGRFARLPIDGEPTDMKVVWHDDQSHQYLVIAINLSKNSNVTYVVRDDMRFRQIQTDAFDLSEELEFNGKWVRLGEAQVELRSKLKPIPGLLHTQQERTVNLENGTRVKIADNKVIVANAKSSRRATVIVDADQPRYVKRNDGHGEYAVLVDGGRAHVIFDQNTIHSFQVDSRLIGNFLGTLLSTNAFEYGGKRHHLISFLYSRVKPSNINNGETYLVREDGTVVFMGYQYVDFDHGFMPGPQYIIDDGFLTLDEFPRQVDLENLEAESEFSPRKKSLIVDNRGDVVDPIEFVEERVRDLTSLNNGSFTPLDDGRFEKLRIALAKNEAGSVVILGPSGSGKTQEVLSFVQALREGQFHELPRTVKVLEIDNKLLSQDATYLGAQDAIISTISAYCAQVRCLLFLDEMHSLRGQGTHAGNNNDVFSRLKQELAGGQLQAIATSTIDEYYAAFGGDNAIKRRFTVVTRDEPTGEKTLLAVKHWLKRFGLAIPADEIIEESIRITNRYNAVGAQPAKATQFWSYLYGMLKVERRNGQVATLEDVRRAAIQYYDLSANTFLPSQRQREIAEIDTALRGSIFGQDNLIDAYIDATTQFYAGVHDETKPAIRIFIPGPKGAGKTESARVYAKARGVNFARIEMTRYRYADPNDFLNEVSQAIEKDPFSVLLFDEIEKASQEVQNAVLAFLDSGKFTVRRQLGASRSAGETSIEVNGLHCTIVATTNAGTDYLLAKRTGGSFGFSGSAQADLAKRHSEELKALEEAVTSDGVSDTFFDRFERNFIVPALPPTKEQFRLVVQHHLLRFLQHTNQSMSDKSVADFLDVMVEEYFYEGMSNRTALDIVARHVRSAVAAVIIQSTREPGQKPMTRIEFDPATRQVKCSEIFGS